MALTEEQQERIRKNKERALEIQKRRREEQELKEANSCAVAEDAKKHRRGEETQEKMPKRAKLGKDVTEEEEDLDLEAFEEGASDLVTKKEAKKMYCLPEGTLQVCAVVEKDNPRHSGWSKMKLYNRSEIRRRARKRFGGKEGLIAERQKREDERFRNDIAKTRDIFKK